MSDLPNLPLIEDGDSYLILLGETGSQLSVLGIERFDNNENSEPTQLRFFDLTPRLRHVVLQHIRRRYPNRSVAV